MLEEDAKDRISVIELCKNVENAEKKRKNKEKKYTNTLLKVYGEKKYKGVDYKIKFDNKD